MPEIKDLTGQNFGYLEVLNFAGMRNHRAFWHCKCNNCGKEKDISGTSLRLGRSKSCGCRPNRENYSHPNNLSGQEFGFIKVLYMTEKRTNNGNIIWHCKCQACGKEVDISAHTLVVGHAHSCGCIHSKGETKIAQILKNNNILFSQEKTFDTCVSPITNAKLRFDFFVNNKYLIEYDGEQHFITYNQGWNTSKEFDERIFRDNLKNEWCKKNNIPLIRIPYTQYNNLCLEDLLLESSKFII